jgi:tripartite-type tricarboxylate transporter receptor subunit TctC
MTAVGLVSRVSPVQTALRNCISDRLGQPFIIENWPGAAGNVSTEQVVRTAPDGYALLLSVPANAINASL